MLDAKFEQELRDSGVPTYDIQLIETAMKLNDWWEADMARELMKKAITKRAYEVLRSRYNFLYHLEED